MIPASWLRTFSPAGPIAVPLAALLVGIAIPSNRFDTPMAGDAAERPQVGGRPLAMDDLVAWCIVPFDSRKRSPEARIAMLERLGFKRYAYDWRTEHLPDTARELRLARDRGISIDAVWMWIDAAADRPGKLGADNERLLAAVKEAGVSTQIWLGFAPDYFEGRSEEEKVARAVEMVRYLSERAAATKSRVALYNHGDWFGESENQVRIIQAVPDKQIGIVYNFHHGHEHIARFDAVVKAIRPYLWVVNLNGMRPEGPKILPFGTGTHERKMLQAVLDSASPGPSACSATWTTPTWRRSSAATSEVSASRRRRRRRRASGRELLLQPDLDQGLVGDVAGAPGTARRPSCTAARATSTPSAGRRRKVP